jgi:hypothetical protein
MTAANKQHCDAAVSTLLDQSVEKRISYIYEDWHINLPNAVALSKRIKELARHPSRIRPKSMLVLAHSGMGKTYISQDVLSDFPVAKNEQYGTTCRPVLYCEVEPATTVQKLLCTIAAAADIPVHTIEARNLQAHVANQLRAANLRLIMVDEIQSLLHVPRTVAQNCCDLLKWLSNVTRRPVVAMGTPDAVELFNRDRQLSSRFRRQDLPRWGVGPELQAFVRTILMQLPLRSPWDPKLLKQDALIRLVELTEGTTGSIIELFKEAAVASLMDGREGLNSEDLFPMG